METFRKQDSPAAIAAEAAGLEWLRTKDGAPVAELLSVGPDWLETRLLRSTHPTREDAATFGRLLAATHAAGANWWGAGPPGLAAGVEAGMPAPMEPAPRWRTFGEFFAESKIEPYLRAARAMTAEARAIVGRAMERVAGGTFDAPQPGLCLERGVSVARTHGDLWGGNIVWAASTGGGSVGTLIDPHAHGGHAETDLAALQVFGSAHLDATLAGYQEVSPLADGWAERVPMHQLHMLLVHVVLFGSSYVGDTVRAARQLL